MEHTRGSKSSNDDDAGRGGSRTIWHCRRVVVSTLHPCSSIEGERWAACVRSRPSRLASTSTSMFTLAAFKGGHGLAEVPGVRRGARQEVLARVGLVFRRAGLRARPLVRGVGVPRPRPEKPGRQAYQRFGPAGAPRRNHAGLERLRHAAIGRRRCRSTSPARSEPSNSPIHPCLVSARSLCGFPPASVSCPRIAKAEGEWRTPQTGAAQPRTWESMSSLNRGRRHEQVIP